MTKPIFRKVALDRLSSPDELDQLPQVVASKAWLALLACAGLLATLLGWSIFVTLPTTVAGRGIVTVRDGTADHLAAVLYLSVDDAGRVEPGMKVQLSLASAREAAFGRLLGTVATVAALPSNREAMLRRVESDAFVDMLIADGAIVEVSITLPRDAASGSYQWSSHSQNGAVRPGTPCTASITVARERPLSLIVP